MNTCTKCSQSKPDDHFYRRKNGQLRAQCKECQNTAVRQRYAEQKDDPDFRAQLRLRDTLSRYNLSEQEYNDLLEAHNGHCALCGKEAELEVDHCHDDGHVRGLLCHRCNLGIGYIENNPTLLRQAAIYLELTEPV